MTYLFEHSSATPAAPRWVKPATWSFHRVIATTAGAVNVLVGLFVVRERPVGFVAILVLVMLALAASARLWRRANQPALWAVMLLTGVLGGYFLLGFPAHAQGAAQRLTQVAVVAFAGAVVLATVLVNLRFLGPVGALVVGFGIAGAVLMIESISAVTFRPSELQIPARSEWLAIRRAVDRGNRSTVDSDLVPPAAGSAFPSTSSGGAGDVDWTDERAPRPDWSAAVDRDSTLGFRFRPHSVATTSYRDNPRRYFEAGDSRSEIWQIGVAPGSVARLEFPPTEPDQFRVSISEARRGVPPWHIMVNQEQLGVSAGAAYRLEFQARADRSRTVIVAVTQAAGSFSLLGLLDTLHLTTAWQRFRLGFTATRSDSNARIHFALGGDAVSVDLAGVTLRNVATDRPVQPPGIGAPWRVRYRFDGLGCRGPDRPAPDPRGEYRILLLGDGFTMGVGVDEQDTFAARLDTLLNAAASGSAGRHAVINCGMPGYGLRESRRLFQGIDATYQPQLVVFVLNPEDDRAEWETGVRSMIERPITRPAALFSIWSRISTQWRMRRTHDYEAMLGELARLNGDAQAAGARLVVLLAPSSRNSQWNMLRRAATPALARTGVALVDLGDTLVAGSPVTDFTVDATDAHPNERVHALLARLLVHPLLTAEHSTPAGAPRSAP